MLHANRPSSECVAVVHPVGCRVNLNQWQTMQNLIIFYFISIYMISLDKEVS